MTVQELFDVLYDLVETDPKYCDYEVYFKDPCTRNTFYKAKRITRTKKHEMVILHALPIRKREA